MIIISYSFLILIFVRSLSLSLSEIVTWFSGLLLHDQRVVVWRRRRPGPDLAHQ